MKKDRWAGTFQQKAEQRLESKRSASKGWCNGRRKYLVTPSTEMQREAMQTTIKSNYASLGYQGAMLHGTPSNNITMFNSGRQIGKSVYNSVTAQYTAQYLGVHFDFYDQYDQGELQWLRPQEAMMLKLQGYEIKDADV